ncbi:MAG TPA: 50S ribosomal protein L10 [Anaerohalosphaeraceae bacterium]|nr:50S ribosomal protein L10 [Anaerohalosphaeraceae bacterium]
MTYYVKGLIQKEYERRLSEAPDFVVLQTIGLNGIDNNRLRGALLEKGIHLMVVKNSLMRRALESLGRAAGAQLFQEGPCTLAWGGDSVVDVAKELVEWTKKLEVLKFKGAFVDGRVLDASGVSELAKMPNRRELQGRVVQSILGPAGRTVGAMLGPGGVIAGCIKSLIEKKEKAA